MILILVDKYDILCVVGYFAKTYSTVLRIGENTDE